MKIISFIILQMVGYLTGFYSQKRFEITIERKLSSTTCTMGYMSVDKKIICYSLELPWVDNLKNISCVPIGSYNGILRYDKKDGWRIQLDNVPNRDAVQIHIGNYTKNTRGCVLVGLDAKIEDCAIQQSNLAYEKLKEAFYDSSNPNSTPNKNIIITFK